MDGHGHGHGHGHGLVGWSLAWIDSGVDGVLRTVWKTAIPTGKEEIAVGKLAVVTGGGKLTLLAFLPAPGNEEDDV
ncbi:hypothetical protein BCON_0122g00110 [Botryotinia convoluta]|uniref:Uncharacterized protein n=1 Tax=Botryotinia convoluta TaxID=54673 RepID=A0A4Z1HXQ9_9HELO|nr:hypothetical protein BCON_0122g00110 [Botryotinia convoluta]